MQNLSVILIWENLLRTHTPQDVEAILAALAQDGACIVADVLPHDLCDRLMADFSHALGEQSWGTDDLGYRDNFYGNKTKRLHGLFSHSEEMANLLLTPLFVRLARSILVDSGLARDIRLSNAELMVLGQGQTNQEMHSDAASWYRAQMVERAAGQEILVSVNCALTDFTQTNGATRVVPGSHLWAPDRQPREEEIELAVMSRGSVLVYTGNVLHSGGENRETDMRVGLYMGYAASWLRPLENQLLTNRVEDVLRLPEAAQQLVDVVPGGFTVFA